MEINVKQPRYGSQLEHAIVSALITALATAGYSVVGIHHEELPRGEMDPLTLADALREVFEYSCQVTLHFRKNGATDGKEIGVFLVQGNGVDIISDWHTSEDEFYKAVERVSNAAHGDGGRLMLELT